MEAYFSPSTYCRIKVAYLCSNVIEGYRILAIDGLLRIDKLLLCMHSSLCVARFSPSFPPSSAFVMILVYWS